MPETKGRSLEAIDRAFNDGAVAKNWTFLGLRRRKHDSRESGIEIHGPEVLQTGV